MLTSIINLLLTSKAVTSRRDKYIFHTQFAPFSDFIKNNPTFKEIVPLVTYRNADQDKLDIYKDNNKKTGIYRWTNKLTGKFYIGSALD